VCTAYTVQGTPDNPMWGYPGAHQGIHRQLCVCGHSHAATLSVLCMSDASAALCTHLDSSRGMLLTSNPLISCISLQHSQHTEAQNTTSRVVASAQACCVCVDMYKAY
jgi:hypothetical protein